MAPRNSNSILFNHSLGWNVNSFKIPKFGGIVESLIPGIGIVTTFGARGREDSPKFLEELLC